MKTGIMTPSNSDLEIGLQLPETMIYGILIM